MCDDIAPCYGVDRRRMTIRFLHAIGSLQCIGVNGTTLAMARVVGEVAAGVGVVEDMIGVIGGDRGDRGDRFRDDRRRGGRPRGGGAHGRPGDGQDALNRRHNVKFYCEYCDAFLARGDRKSRIDHYRGGDHREMVMKWFRSHAMRLQKELVKRAVVDGGGCRAIRRHREQRVRLLRRIRLHYARNAMNSFLAKQRKQKKQERTACKKQSGKATGRDGSDESAMQPCESTSMLEATMNGKNKEKQMISSKVLIPEVQKGPSSVADVVHRLRIALFGRAQASALWPPTLGQAFPARLTGRDTRDAPLARIWMDRQQPAHQTLTSEEEVFSAWTVVGRPALSVRQAKKRASRLRRRTEKRVAALKAKEQKQRKAPVKSARRSQESMLLELAGTKECRRRARRKRGMQPRRAGGAFGGDWYRNP